MPTQEQLIERAFRPGVIYAVVGVSRFSVKSGNKIFSYLRKNGLRTYAVNPKAEIINNEKCYPDLKALPQRPDVVNIVLPPEASLEIVKQAHRQCVPVIWLQPGAESPAILEYARANNITLVHNACIMTEYYRRKNFHNIDKNQPAIIYGRSS